MQTVTKAGEVTATVTGLDDNGAYEFRAVIQHPLLTLYGAEVRTGGEAGVCCGVWLQAFLAVIGGTIVVAPKEYDMSSEPDSIQAR